MSALSNSLPLMRNVNNFLIKLTKRSQLRALAYLIPKHTHNLILHGFPCVGVEMHFNPVSGFADCLYKVGLILFGSDGCHAHFLIIHKSILSGDTRPVIKQAPFTGAKVLNPYPYQNRACKH